MSARGRDRRRRVRAEASRSRASWVGALATAALTLSCGGGGGATSGAAHVEAPHEAPLVAAQPGAWFDAQGGLMVVGAGRRLRLLLSAPIAACSQAFDAPGSPADVATRASLPFHLLNEVCRNERPAILLPEEGKTASPAELERSYHELARCAANDWHLTEGWIPEVIAQSDPCPLALGLGWRLPETKELHGLTLDDRKAVAGALFDVDGHQGFGELLLYARDPQGELALATLSPNAAEVAPELTPERRRRPFFGASLRCVRESDATPSGERRFPVLPGATECLREQRRARTSSASVPTAPAPPEVQRLKAWLSLAETTPTLLRTEAGLKELTNLLAPSALDALCQRAREERALTERYAELADSVDDPDASPSERERRRAEFAHLRKRLGGRILGTPQGAGRNPTELLAVLFRLQPLLEAAAGQLKPSKRGTTLSYGPLLGRITELRDGKAPTQ